MLHFYYAFGKIDTKNLDLSDNSIGYAKQSAQDKNLDIEYRNSDYIKEPIDGEYDLATMIYCDFGVLSPEDRQILLKKVYETLSPGGCFLFDIFTPYEYAGRDEYKLWDYEENGFWRKEPHLLLQSLYHYDHTYLTQYIVITDTETTYYNNWEHTFTVEEIQAELQTAGFKGIECYGNVAGADYYEGSKTLCVLARKE